MFWRRDNNLDEAGCRETGKIEQIPEMLRLKWHDFKIGYACGSDKFELIQDSVLDNQVDGDVIH